MAFTQESTPLKKYATEEQRKLAAVIRDMTAMAAYVDSQIGANNELNEILANGNTTGGTSISVTSGDDIILNNGGFTATLREPVLAGNIVLTYPTTTGTIALTTDISNIGTDDLTINTSGARKLIMGGALATDIFAIMNSADTTALFQFTGDGKINTKRNITNSDRLFIGGNNTDTTADSAGYDNFAVVGYGNSSAGITHVFGSNNTTAINTTDPRGFVIGDNNDHKTNSIGILGHDNDGGRFVFGKGNYSRGIFPMSMFGESNLTTTTGNGFPNKPVYIIGDHNQIPNSANTGNSIHLGVRTTNGDPYTTVHEDNFLIGTLNTWDTNYDMSARGVYYTKNGTAPTSLAADSFGMYSADIVAGNAAPHFRTEVGDVIKLYKETTAVGTTAFVANTSGIVDDSATFGGYKISQIVGALQAHGLLA